MGNNQKKLTVLIAEDDEEDYLIFSEIIKGFDINLIWVKDGAKADQYIFYRNESNMKSCSLDFILLDIRLPHLNGFELIKKIKSCAHTKKTPVAILSNSESEKDISEAYENGVNFYIKKPFRPKEMEDLKGLFRLLLSSIFKFPET